MPPPIRAHDRAILDALEAQTPVKFEGPVWRITRAGRDPITGSTANGRWSPGPPAEILYTSLEREGALAEIGYRLSLEPVWPSAIRHEIHQLNVVTERVLALADIKALTPLGVDIARYDSFDYTGTKAIAAAAHFLDFDGLLVPSARHNSTNLVLFTDRGATVPPKILSTEPVDWPAWLAHQRQTKS